MKIKLTESQIERLKNIFEGQEDRYNREVVVYFEKGNNFNVKGLEVADILKSKIRLSFDIDVEYRSWGIKGILVYGVSGPNQIEMEVEYYVNEEGDIESEVFPVSLDWENALSIQNEEGSSIITVGDEVNITVEGDAETGFRATKIEVTVLTL